MLSNKHAFYDTILPALLHCSYLHKLELFQPKSGQGYTPSELCQKAGTRGYSEPQQDFSQSGCSHIV